jgi:hypothetical protein
MEVTDLTAKSVGFAQIVNVIRRSAQNPAMNVMAMLQQLS